MLASVSSSIDLLPRRFLDRGLRSRGRGGRGVAPARRGGVGLRLGVDERSLRSIGIQVAAGGQRGHDAPAQIGVDHQTRQVHRCGFVVQQRRQHGDVVRRQHRRAQRIDERQLMVRTRGRLACQVQQPVAERRPAVRSRPARIGVGAQRGLRLQQQALRHAHLGLGVQATHHERHEVAGRQFGVAGHLPGRRPRQRAGQRIGDVGDAGQHGLQRVRIQPQRAVGQVVVVDQDQLSARNPLQRRNIRASVRRRRAPRGVPAPTCPMPSSS